MMTINNQQTLPAFLIGIFSLIVIVAFSYIGLFNHPTDDDFARAFNDGRSYFQSVKSWYFYHNGRFTNALLAEPRWLYKDGIYQYLHIVILMGLLISLLLFFRQFLTLYGRSNKHSTIILSGMIVTSGLVSAPNLMQWFYWYAGSSVYMISAVLILLNASCLIRLIKQKSHLLVVLSSFLSYFSAGNHEMAMLITLAITFSMAIIGFLHARQHYLITPFLFAVAGALTLIMAPGTSNRLDYLYDDSTIQLILRQLSSILTEIVPSFLSGLSYWLRDGQAYIIALISFLVGCTQNNVSTKFNLSRMIMALLFVSFSVLMAISVVPIMLDYKVNINDPSRVASLAYYIFLCLTTMSLFGLGVFIKERLNHWNNANKSLSWLIVGFSIVFIVLSVTQQNSRILFDDFKNNKHVRQQEDWGNWQVILEQARQYNQKNIELPALTRVLSLPVSPMGITASPNYRVNKAFALWQGFDPQTSIKRYNFDNQVRESIARQYKSIQESFNLQGYKSDYQNYLLIQVPYRTKDSNQFCVKLVNYEQKTHFQTKDDAFFDLNFKWSDSQYCGDFTSRTVYCDEYQGDFFCRIPLPMDFSGLVNVNWKELRKNLVIK